MEKPKAEVCTELQLNFHSMIAYIEKKYKIEVRDYKGKYSEQSDTNIEYQDYWHWLMNNVFDTDGLNGSYQYIDITSILDNDLDDGEAVPDWVKEITQLIKDEFEEYMQNGELKVYVSW